jgi:TRAP-type mannitol/chloroaromatic compound transport system permease small subunit
METTIRVIDSVNDRLGKLAAWIVVPLTVIVLLEIAMRYFANNPTIWVYDVSWMLFSVFFLLGGGYTMVHKKHVRIDLLYSMLPRKGQAIYELFFFLVIFLPTMAVIGLRAIEYAAAAWETGQSLSTTVWTFPAAPIRTVMPLAFFLLFLQGIAEVLRNTLILIGKEQSDD